MKKEILERELKGLQNQVNQDISLILKGLNQASDLVEYISRKEVFWLINNPFRFGSSIINMVIEDINKNLSQGQFLVNFISRKNNSIQLIIGNTKKRRMISWDLFLGKVNIIPWDQVEAQSKRKEEIKLKIKELEEELEEIIIIGRNPNALLNNGLFWAYLKASWRKKKYLSEINKAIEEIQAEIKEKEILLEDINRKDNLRLEDKDIFKLLNLLSQFYLRFPRIKSYNHYLEIKKRYLEEIENVR